VVISRFISSVSLIFLVLATQLSAQKTVSLTLENAVDMALRNNHLLNIKKLQIEEKRQKISEDKAKFLPVIILGANYQYNSSLPGLTLTRGQFGELPLGTISIPLPSVDEVIRMGNHNIYNAGVTLYQPVSQMGKINAGVNVSRTDMQITRAEETKAGRQIRQSVEKLYYGLLIAQKQMEEADFRAELAKSKLNDAQNALAAGKTIDVSIYGLAASAADEEKNVLKLKIQYDDYAADLKQIMGIDPDQLLVPEPVPSENLVIPLAPIDTSLSMATSHNSELKIASLVTEKAGYSIKASQFGYLPDIGLLGGYSYQKGSVIYPKNNAFIGASLKWNLQDMLFNHTIERQRIYAKKQAEENLANTREQVNKDIMKSYRKLKQSEELINVAAKALNYRREDLRIQTDKHNSGMSLEADLLAAKAAFAKAEADYFSAQMNYKIALSELNSLTGNY
jgi:outer membrane protein TolC